MSEPLRPVITTASSPAASALPAASAGMGDPVHIGLALSGGATKAVAHVGVLKALIESGIVIDSLAGTSGGSIVAALYATGRPIADIEQLALSLSWKQMAQVKLSRLGFLSSDKIERYLVSIMGDVRFEELQVPLAIVATNLVTGRAQVFRQGRVALACRASCSIPQVYKPVEIDGEYFVDGGVVEELPLATLRMQFAPAIAVGVNLVAEGGVFNRPRHVFHLAWRLGVIVSRHSARAMEHLADVMVRPRLEQYSGVHFRAIPEMMQEGYEAGLAAAQEIRAFAEAHPASPAEVPVAARPAPVRAAAPAADTRRAFGPTSIVQPPSGA